MCEHPPSCAGAQESESAVNPGDRELWRVGNPTILQASSTVQRPALENTSDESGSEPPGVPRDRGRGPRLLLHRLGRLGRAGRAEAERDPADRRDRRRRQGRQRHRPGRQPRRGRRHLRHRRRHARRRRPRSSPSAKKFHDFRKMLDEMGKHIDAVTVSTPDHRHALARSSASGWASTSTARSR